MQNSVDIENIYVSFKYSSIFVYSVNKSDHRNNLRYSGFISLIFSTDRFSQAELEKLRWTRHDQSTENTKQKY